MRKFGLRGSSVHSVTQLRRMGTAAGLPPRPSHAERTAAERRGDVGNVLHDLNVFAVEWDWSANVNNSLCTEWS